MSEGLRADAPVRVLTAQERTKEKELISGFIRWSGVVPYRKWTTFYTKAIAKLTSSPDLKLQVDKLGTLAPEKHLFLNVRCERLLGTPHGKKLQDINERLGLF